jgi:ATP-dependent exoDNAse (exonuclease V) alpha subunit
MTVDSLVARARSGSVELGEQTTVFFDEAGMGDTRRLDALTRTADESGGKLVLIGDARQLPAIGAGGMFEEIERDAPTVRLQEVRRTSDPEERRAWADLRAGRAEEAMAHYQARGQLHFADTRDETVEAAVKQWSELAKPEGAGEVALMSERPRAAPTRRARRTRRPRGRTAGRGLRCPRGRPCGVHCAASPQGRAAG